MDLTQPSQLWFTAFGLILLILCVVGMYRRRRRDRRNEREH